MTCLKVPRQDSFWSKESTMCAHHRCLPGLIKVYLGYFNFIFKAELVDIWTSRSIELLINFFTKKQNYGYLGLNPHNIAD